EVEALVVFVPLGAVVLDAHFITLLHGVELSSVIGGGEVILEVLFAGNVSAPRGLAAGAVGKGADGLLATGIGCGLQQGVAGGGAADLYRSLCANAAIEAGAVVQLPETFA